MYMRRAALLALTSTALVAGCNRGAGNNAAAGNTAGNTASNQAATTNAAAPAPAAGAEKTVAGSFLAGHWGPAGNCSLTLSFSQDGTAQSSDEPQPGRWRLEGGNMLVIEPPGQPPQRMAVERNGDSLVMVTPGGRQVLTRCPAPASGAAAAPGAEAPEAAEEEQ
jgi:hypothetical protein